MGNFFFFIFLVASDVRDNSTQKATLYCMCGVLESSEAVEEGEGGNDVNARM